MFLIKKTCILTCTGWGSTRGSIRFVCLFLSNRILLFSSLPFLFIHHTQRAPNLFTDLFMLLTKAHWKCLNGWTFWELMGEFSGALELLIILAINDRMSIVSFIGEFWEKIWEKRRPHCHNAKRGLWENRPHCHKFGGLSAPFIFMGNSWTYGSGESLIVCLCYCTLIYMHQ